MTASKRRFPTELVAFGMFTSIGIGGAVYLPTAMRKVHQQQVLHPQAWSTAVYNAELWQAAVMTLTITGIVFAIALLFMLLTGKKLTFAPPQPRNPSDDAGDSTLTTITSMM